MNSLEINRMIRDKIDPNFTVSAYSRKFGLPYRTLRKAYKGEDMNLKTLDYICQELGLTLDIEKNIADMHRIRKERRITYAQIQYDTGFELNSIYNAFKDGSVRYSTFLDLLDYFGLELVLKGESENE